MKKRVGKENPERVDLELCQCFVFSVDAQFKGQRIDQFLGQHCDALGDGFSRAIFQGLIRNRYVLVDSLVPKTGYRLKAGECVEVYVPPPKPSELVPEEVDFVVLHEDEDVIVINKPPGLVVHPANGNMSGTLVHGLLYHCQDLAGVSGEVRPGIVHRLDKDTSGVMVVAKNDKAHHSLVDQFRDKKVRKIYHAIIDGRFAVMAGRFASCIGRHPLNRKKMAVVTRGGKEAVTNWKIVKLFAHDLSLVEIELETGRTHQIRVHMAANNAPVAGDAVYGRKNKLYDDLGIVRQCLHASKLTFLHPGNGREMTVDAPLWPDMATVLEKLSAGTRS